MGLLLSRGVEVRGITLLPNPAGICGFSHTGKGKWGLLYSNTWRPEPSYDHSKFWCLPKKCFAVGPVASGYWHMTWMLVLYFLFHPGRSNTILNLRVAWRWLWNESRESVDRKCSARLYQSSQRWPEMRVTPLPFPSLLFSSGHRAHLTCTEQDYGVPLSGQFLKRAENSTSQKEKHILHYKGKDSRKTSRYHHLAASSKWAGAKSVPKCLS